VCEKVCVMEGCECVVGGIVVECEQGGKALVVFFWLVCVEGVGKK